MTVMDGYDGDVTAFCHVCRWAYVGGTIVEADAALRAHIEECRERSRTGEGVTA